MVKRLNELEISNGIQVGCFLPGFFPKFDRSEDYSNFNKIELSTTFRS